MVIENGTPDNKWHKSSDFTEELGDGDVHAKRDNLYTDEGLGTLIMAVVYDYYTTGKIKTKEIYNNAALTKNTTYEKYEYDTDENLTEKTYYFDGVSIDPVVIENGTPDNKWHKASEFVTLDDGIHAKRDNLYTDEGLGTLIMAVVYDYYTTGKIKTKEIYNNAALTKNTTYEKYTYDVDENLTEKTYYFDGVSIDPVVIENGTPDNKWHKASEFVTLDDLSLIHI